MSGNGDGPPRTLADVYYDERGLEGDDSGQSAMPKDIYNAPYARKGAILRALGWEPGWLSLEKDTEKGTGKAPYCFFWPVEGWHRGPYGASDALWLTIASQVHDIEMIQYLRTAWERWKGMPMENRCKFFRREKDGESDPAAVPALVPSNFAQRSEPGSKAGTDVHSQTNWYHTDDETPIFEGLLETLESDILVAFKTYQSMLRWRDKPQSRYFYSLVTHPGHHAGKSSIGGYCYVNIAALIAHLILHPAYEEHGKYKKYEKVAILDVDYHCGNGTISIFWDRPDVFVASIHADPSGDYPWNSGFADQIGEGPGEGKTLNLPLTPGAGWAEYEKALRAALAAIKDFGAEAIVVSLGLDTHRDDPVQEKATAGMGLTSEDYFEMGKLLGGANLQLAFVQEGGYQVAVAGQLVAQVFRGVEAEFNRKLSRKRRLD